MKKLDGLSLKELEDLSLNFGEKKFRGAQLYLWLYRDGVSSFGDMTNLPVAFRDKLAVDYDFTVLDETERFESSDGSVKFLFSLEDGERIEAVLLKDGRRLSGCVSTQVGCRMGCRFCATSEAVGFRRNLASGEILRQVAFLRKACLSLTGERLGNLVFMGMGEPLDNRPALFKALEILLDDGAFGFSHRKVTVSTCGITDGIGELFALKTPVNLAVSVNAPSEELRRELMPVARKYPLDELLSVLKNLDLDRRKRVTLEYVLLGGVNDSVEDAENFFKLIKGVKAKINLIIYNDSPYSKFKSPGPEAADRFQRYLIDRGVSAFVRKRLGSDVAGACGQLAASYGESSRRGGIYGS